ncbi:hypothetical protein Y600_6464 [Burkholderia pseudomallei MSHR3709]|nr:hypothetical protein Y600_6464 [Burkholderia pseudomallei MSHR3709]
MTVASALSIDTIAWYAPVCVLMSRFETVCGLLTALICATIAVAFAWSVAVSALVADADSASVWNAGEAAVPEPAVAEPNTAVTAVDDSAWLF